MSAERYSSLWKDPLRYFTSSKNLVNDSKVMLVESLLDDDDVQEEREREERIEIDDSQGVWGKRKGDMKRKTLSSYQDYLEAYQQYCSLYSQTKGRRFQQPRTGVEEEREDLEDLEDILKYLSSYSSQKSLFDTYLISSAPSHQGNLLHLSIQFNDLNLMKLLLKYQFNPSYPDHKHGNTSLHYAAIAGNPHLLKTLLQIVHDHPPPPPPSPQSPTHSSSPLHSPSSHSNDSLINFQNLFGKTCLHYCCEYGSDECVKILLQSVPPSSPVHSSQHIPCSPSPPRHQQLLNLNLRDHNGNTPLHLACIDGSLLCVQFLLIAGCDLTIRNNDQKTALDVVRSMSLRDGIRKELESHICASQSIATTPLATAPIGAAAPMKASAAGGLFDGMEVKETHPRDPSSGDDLFAGLSVATNSSSPAKELLEISPRHLTTTYMHNKAENPSAIPAIPLVPTGRWVVIQSNRLVIDRSSRRLIIHRNKKSAAQWGQRWRSDQLEITNSSTSSLDLIDVPVYSASSSPTNPPPSSTMPPGGVTATGGVFNKLRQLTEKLKSSLSSPSAETTSLPSEEFLESLPPSLRDTVTSTDDGTEIVIGEISEKKWAEVIESYPVYVMEVEGSDPVFEQYLRERNFELRRRRLSLRQKARESNGSGEGREGTADLRSSFIASSQPVLCLRGEGRDRDIDLEEVEVEGMVERLSTELQHFSLVIGSEVMTDEEIILREDIQRIQEQIASTEQELEFLEIEIQDWLQRPLRATNKMTGSAVGSEQAINVTREKQQQEQEQEPSPPNHRMDLDQFELMLGTSTDTSLPMEPLTVAQQGAEVETEVPTNSKKEEDEENIPPASETTHLTLEAPSSQAIEINELSRALEGDIEEEETTEIAPPASAMHSDFSHGGVQNFPETEAQEEELGDSDDEELNPTKETGDSDDEDDDNSSPLPPLPLPSVSSPPPCLQSQPLSPSSTSLPLSSEVSESVEIVESISDFSPEPSATTAPSPLSPELRIDPSSFHPLPSPSISSSTAAPIETNFFPKPREESPTLLQPEEEESEARVEAEEVS